ncbi:hypothetical protein LEJE111609_16130 [Lelliottia jeotgali]
MPPACLDTVHVFAGWRFAYPAYKTYFSIV